MTYGFEVVHRPVSRYKTITPGWRVRLPHQCDHWDIAGEDLDGVPLDEAIHAMEEFVSEAQDALSRLRAATPDKVEK